MLLSFRQIYYILSCMKYKDDIRRNVQSALFKEKKKKCCQSPKQIKNNLNNHALVKALSVKQMFFSIQPKGTAINTLNPQNK